MEPEGAGTGVEGDYDQNTLQICINYKRINKNTQVLRSKKLP